MKKTVLLLVTVVAVMMGCRKQVSDYERPDFEPVPTLNAILSEGQPVWAQVSLAQCLDSVHPAVCTDAEVLLYVDGQFTEKLQHGGEGYYFGETTAEALHQYACKVVIPGFDTLFAHTEMPKKPVVTRVEIMDNATVDEEGNSCPAFLITFKTEPDKSLFYNASIDAFFITYYMQDSIVTNYTSQKGTITSSINTDDPVLLNEGSDRLLFSNEIIIDTAYTLKVNSSFGSHGYGHTGQSQGSTIVRSGWAVVRMQGVSESAYHYLKSQDAFEAPDGYSNLFLGVVTPLNFYSNVENGRGIFAAINTMTCDTVFFNPEN